MTDTKHTPGPWKITGCGRNDLGNYTVKIGADGETVAHTFHIHDDPKASFSIAHLIAAAPEMLKALEMVTGTWIAVDGDERVCMDKVLAAIAKAKGESQ